MRVTYFNQDGTWCLGRLSQSRIPNLEEKIKITDSYDDSNFTGFVDRIETHIILQPKPTEEYIIYLKAKK